MLTLAKLGFYRIFGSVVTFAASHTVFEKFDVKQFSDLEICDLLHQNESHVANTVFELAPEKRQWGVIYRFRF